MIVLCYNQSQFVVETLESVKAQTYGPTQLIIVDDCSTDESVATINRWLRENGIDCTFIRHQQNLGLCKTLNDALAVATGKYISMVASDDIWLADKIARQVEIMEAQPEYVGVLYSDAFQIDERGTVLPNMYISHPQKIAELPQTQVLNTLLKFNFIPAVTALVRRTCYDKVGLYDENLPWEDWDMWMRLARHYSFMYSSAPSAKYRRHRRSMTHSDPVRMTKECFKVCFKQFSLGDLNREQKLTLTATLLAWSEDLYGRNDNEVSEMLLALWRASGSKRAQWMYWFTRLGFSFRNWQRANGCRRRLNHVRAIVSGSNLDRQEHA